MTKEMRGIDRSAKKDTRKKRMKRWLSFFLTLVILMTGFSSVPMKAEAASYPSEWWLWRQSQSDYAVMRKSGCRVVAFARASAEAGLFGYSNPDGLYEWGKKNGKFSGEISEKGSFGDFFSSYLKTRGVSSISKRVVKNVAAKSDAGCKEIMNLLNQGYYVFLASQPHTTYIGREASLKAGTPIVIDNGGQYNFKSYNRSGVSAWNVIGFLINGGAPADTTPPVISNVRVANYGGGYRGYDVYCDVTDNVGVTKVAFPTWTINNGQDDLVWHVGSCVGGNTYKYSVKASEHNFEETYYTTHIYAYDAAGNERSTAVIPNVCIDWTKPVISDIKITDVSDTGYTIQCKVVDNVMVSAVKFRAWTKKDGTNDLLEKDGIKNGDIYSLRVNTSDHNGEYGVYCSNILACDHYGLSASADVPECTVEAPVKKYTVTFDSQGGTSIDAIKDIVENTKIDKLPDPPTRSDYEFVGWYTEVGGKGVKFDENTVINQDMTVYAFWRLKVSDVPRSFWVDDIPDQTYTGKAVKPQVFVYEGNRQLQENIDYTLTYKMNKKASDTAPYVIVRGIGDYSGTEKVSFSILPKNIAEDGIEVGNLTVSYYDRVKSVVPTVTWGSKKLEYKKDFIIETA